MPSWSVWSLTYRVARVGTVAAALAATLCGCGENSVTSTSPVPPRFAMLSTFPAEMRPLLEQMTVDHTETVNGRLFRVGTLAGVPVMLGVTGIGLVNAATTTGELLDRFDVAGVIVSAVAGGTTQQIGDVVVPDAFAFKDGTAYAADPQWLAVVNEIAASGRAKLERCTMVANPPPTQPVFMLGQPLIRVGGVGRSSDPYGGKPFACISGGNDLYGCDLPSPLPPSGECTPMQAEGGGGATHGNSLVASVQAAEVAVPVTEDMETAAIAKEASVRGLRFIGFRAISDGGTGDPLGLTGFLPQFSAYYRFAARNAAAAAVPFLKEVAAQHG